MRSELEKIKVVIAEDQKIILHSLISLLISFGDIEIAGTASDKEGLLKKLESTKPDVVLLDIKSPSSAQLEITRTINEKMPWVKVISLASHNHPNYIKEMLKNGTKGFLSKNCTLEELHESIKSVYEGKNYFCKLCSKLLINEFTSEPTQNANDFQSLTRRELQIIWYLSEGDTTKEIASKLFISEKTIERHKTNLLRKMNSKNTAHLVKVAVENGLLIF
jgi:DNA-binding NarL/FixJ family response regulator